MVRCISKRNDGTNGAELWRIDRSGTVEMVEDAVPGGGIRPGSASSSPTAFSNVNGTLYFQANDGTNGVELWRINTSGFAEMVEDNIPGGGINPFGANAYPTNLTNVGGTLYFSAVSFLSGRELWRINALGIAEIVEDAVPGGGIRAGSSSSYPANLTNVNGTLYFAAHGGANIGNELWRINTAGVAVLVEDSVPGGGIQPGYASSNPANLTDVGGTLFFSADDGTRGIELWRINSGGTAEIVEDIIPGGGIAPGNGSASPAQLTNMNGTLYFTAVEPTNGLELWRVGGSGIAQLVEDAVPGGGISPEFASSSPVNLTNSNGVLYFQANDGTNGVELWRVNGLGVAEMVDDAVPGDGIETGSMPSNPTSMTVVGDTLYFTANDGTNGIELWRKGSTGVAELVEDSVPGGGIRPGLTASAASNLTNVNGALYFSANDGTNGVELWRINGSGRAVMVEDNIPGGGINSAWK